ncbi:GRF1-interacting factor 3 [Apostasia shenzhenica]|uniref:GRF1-interacting factor 3 n=1 Tax=Apostasia shenzhenica TaxID=1088818 RepID=A0A2I0A9Q9_9ASPA|nr:GRF1-interacting factor 3 [Apostasia shenzhenica]
MILLALNPFAVSCYVNLSAVDRYEYQAQLQKNLLYLAAIADAQPPNQAVRPQMVHHPAMQQGSPFGQQVVGFPPRPPLQYNTQQIQEPQQQQQQIYPQVMPFPGNMGMRPGMMNGMLAIHPEPFRGTNSELSAGPSRSEASRGGGNVPASSTIDVPGKKQDAGKLTTPHSSSAPPTTSAADGSSTSAAQRGAGEATTQTPAATEKSEVFGILLQPYHEHPLPDSRHLPSQIRVVRTASNGSDFSPFPYKGQPPTHPRKPTSLQSLFLLVPATVFFFLQMDLIFEWPVEALVFRYSATIGGSLCTCLALLAAALSFWRFRFLGSASASKTPAAAVVSLTPPPPPPSAATNSFREPTIFASSVPDGLCREDCESSPKGRFTAYFLAEEDVNGGEEEVEIDGVNDVLD